GLTASAIVHHAGRARVEGNERAADFSRPIRGPYLTRLPHMQAGRLALRPRFLAHLGGCGCTGPTPPAPEGVPLGGTLTPPPLAGAAGGDDALTYPGARASTRNHSSLIRRSLKRRWCTWALVQTNGLAVSL